MLPMQKHGEARCLLLLLALAVGLRAWTIPHTVVPARDGIGFIRYAWQLEHRPWLDVLRASHHPPGYPLSILAISLPLRYLIAGDVLPLSAQFAANLAGILLVIPMFYLGRELFDRRVGFGAALLFQCFPVSARVLSDTLSEPLFLLALTTGLLMAARALGRPTAWRFGLCGACAGLAYLTRPEGAALPLAVGLALLGWRFLAAAQWPRRTVAVSALALAMGTATVAGPYVAIIGRLTQKPTGQKLFEVGGSDTERTAGSGPLWAMWYSDEGPARSSPQLGWCVRAVLIQVFKGYHYLGFPLVLLGLWHFRDRFRLVPGAAVLSILMVLQIGLLLRVAMVSGYVSERHVLPVLLCGLYWVAATLGWAGDKLAAGLRLAKPRTVAVMPLLLLAISGLPGTLKPLHAHRGGFRAAGDWLAHHATAADTIIDPFGWAAHYAGRTYENLGGVPSAGAAVNRYVVWDGAKSSYRRADIDAEQVRAWKRGQPVYHWPAQIPLEKAAVVVYFLPADQNR